MEILYFFQSHPIAFLLIVGLFSLCIGSFLNVVIYRLPRMMYQSWRMECSEVLNLGESTRSLTFTLAKPNSHCPHCKKAVPLWTNIPLIGYLLLKGKCHYCHKNIGWRYPAVELLTAILSILVAVNFGFSWQTLAALIFTWGLIALVFIDIEHQLLPDSITLPLLWLGLFCNLFGLFVPLQDAVLGAIVGYLCLWIIAKIFHRVRGIEGMGYGDLKLLAMLGAWWGVAMLLYILLMASIVGVVVGMIWILLKRQDRHSPLPFGPYLAGAGWIIMFFGSSILHWHLI